DLADEDAWRLGCSSALIRPRGPQLTAGEGDLLPRQEHPAIDRGEHALRDAPRRLVARAAALRASQRDRPALAVAEDVDRRVWGRALSHDQDVPMAGLRIAAEHDERTGDAAFRTAGGSRLRNGHGRRDEREARDEEQRNGQDQLDRSDHELSEGRSRRATGPPYGSLRAITRSAAPHAGIHAPRTVL